MLRRKLRSRYTDVIRDLNFLRANYENYIPFMRGHSRVERNEPAAMAACDLNEIRIIDLLMAQSSRVNCWRRCRRRRPKTMRFVSNELLQQSGGFLRQDCLRSVCGI